MKNQNCYSFWKLAKSLKIDDIVALWCDVEPSQLNHFIQTTGYSPSCADAKRVVIEDALVSGELDYIDEGTPTSNGKLWIGNPVEELIQKNRLRINKECLKEWFVLKYEQGYLEEIPTFLNEEKQQAQVLQQQRESEPLVDDEPTHHKSVGSMQALITTLIKMAEYDKADLADPYGEFNKLIQAKAETLGLSVKKDFIAKWLKRADDVL